MEATGGGGGGGRGRSASGVTCLVVVTKETVLLPLQGVKAHNQY